MNIVAFARCRPRETTSSRSESIRKMSRTFSWNKISIGKSDAETVAIIDEDAVGEAAKQTDYKKHHLKAHMMRRRRGRNLKLELEAFLP